MLSKFLILITGFVQTRPICMTKSLTPANSNISAMMRKRGRQKERTKIIGNKLISTHAKEEEQATNLNTATKQEGVAVAAKEDERRVGGVNVMAVVPSCHNTIIITARIPNTPTLIQTHNSTIQIHLLHRRHILILRDSVLISRITTNSNNSNN